jgi:hypothetical protein
MSRLAKRQERKSVQTAKKDVARSAAQNQAKLPSMQLQDD